MTDLGSNNLYGKQQERKSLDIDTRLFESILKVNDQFGGYLTDKRRRSSNRDGEGLVHTVAVILIGIAAQDLFCAVSMLKHNRGMRDSVEHIGLHGGIMQHILEDDLLPYL